MRKTTFAAVVATAALALAGCASGGTDTSTGESDADQSGVVETDEGDDATDEDALVVWVDETREAAVKQAAEQFTADTGTPVETVLKNFEDIRTDFTTQVPTGHGPDITVGAHDWLGELTANGVVAPIEIGDKASEFEEAAIAAFTMDGQLYGMPYAIENVALLRNVDLAPDAPATWDDVVAAGNASGAKYPFLIQMNGEDGDPYTFYGLQTSFGSTVFKQNDDGSYTNELNLAEGGDAFAQFLADNGTKGAGMFDPDRNYDIVLDAFSKGESPFLIGGPWMLESIEAGGINLSVDAIPSAGGEAARPFAGVAGFYMSAQAKNAIDANDFLVNYIATEDIQYALYEAGGRPPALTAAAEKAAADPLTAGFMAAGEHALPMPSIPEMNEVWGPWGRTEAAIVNGSEADPGAAWAHMIEEIQKAIDG